jgi:hypothetical protein
LYQPLLKSLAVVNSGLLLLIECGFSSPARLSKGLEFRVEHESLGSSKGILVAECPPTSDFHLSPSHHEVLLSRPDGQSKLQPPPSPFALLP